jgi:Flp pilus assembly protein TadG
MTRDGWFARAARVTERSGAAAVEFALVAPMLVALLLGIVAFGSFLGFAHGLQTIASEAARAAVAGLDTAERVALATDAARRGLAANPLLTGSAITIAAGPDMSDPDLFTVTLRGDLNATMLHLVPRQIPMPRSLARTASIRRGGL